VGQAGHLYGKASVKAGLWGIRRGRYTLEDGSGTLLVEQAQAGSAFDQTISTTLRVTRYDAGGNPVEEGESI